MTNEQTFDLVIEHDDVQFFHSILPAMFKSMRDQKVTMRIDSWQDEELTFTLVGKKASAKRVIKDSFADDAPFILETMR